MLTGGLPRPRRRTLVVIALAVLGVHAMLLGGIGIGKGAAPADMRVASMQVREIAVAVAIVAEPEPAALAAPAPATPGAPAAPVPPRAKRVVRPTGPAAPAPAAADLAAAPPAEARAEEIAPADVATVVAPLPMAQALAAAPAAPVAVDGVILAAASPPVAEAEAPPPTYPTRLPPAATLRYDLHRGLMSGSGELRWQPDGERYRMRLEGSVLGLSVIKQASEGTVGAAGLAPRRFTDQRIRRAMQAANFQREAGKVSFSGPSHEVVLNDGAQDRLSWMVQLAAIAAADPARRVPGAKTVMQVVGARGDSAIWVFRCVGLQEVATRGGAVQALQVVREPHGAHDTGVEAWLDPARHFLPLRATIRNAGDGDALELKLKDMTIGG